MTTACCIDNVKINLTTNQKGDGGMKCMESAGAPITEHLSSQGSHCRAAPRDGAMRDQFPEQLQGWLYSFLDPLFILEWRCISWESAETVNGGEFWSGCARALGIQYADPHTALPGSVIPVWYKQLLVNRMQLFGRGVSGRCCSCVPFSRIRLADLGVGSRLLRLGVMEAQVLTTLPPTVSLPKSLAIEVQFRDKYGELMGSLYRDFLDQGAWPHKLLTRAPLPLGTASVELHFTPRTPHHFARATCLQLTLSVASSLSRAQSPPPLSANSFPSDLPPSIPFPRIQTVPLLIAAPGSDHCRPTPWRFMFTAAGGAHLAQVELRPQRLPPAQASLAIIELRMRCQTEGDSSMTLLIAENPSQWSWSSTRNWERSTSSRTQRNTAVGGLTLALSDCTFKHPLTLRVSVLSRSPRPQVASTLRIDKALLTWTEANSPAVNQSQPPSSSCTKDVLRVTECI
eukprot:Protomagalhaensia_sp_Gyna_25__832@NODE_13_length_8454_cov_77_233868_g9_i0_p4_GENE_NODE_13_length_8454_cov_77_233868_g9_i0NODE_13_length_8454_cov_77_233868_g9_i0_p4_ORF_typecomplete_len457_score49_01_NODE_13_length_8454_cov_77_233868_g9_i0841454